MLRFDKKEFKLQKKSLELKQKLIHYSKGFCSR
jgi:hypothetical protein